MPFAGFDSASYPGDSLMQDLWDNSNLYWVGFYLPVSGPGLENKLTWKLKYKVLRDIGWGVAPLYVGKQPNSAKLNLKKGQEQPDGYRDGMEAAGFASAEGMPPRTVLYFDLEIPTNDRAWKDHYLGWTKALLDQGYVPGLYCSYLSATPMADFIRQRDPRAVPEIWAWRIDKYPAGQVYSDLNAVPAPDPAGSTAASATSWQFVQKSHLTLHGHRVDPVDFDSSSYTDPGQRTVSTTP
jgi:Domain of unknown function (DUF1906)